MHKLVPQDALTMQTLLRSSYIYVVKPESVVSAEVLIDLLVDSMQYQNKSPQSDQWDCSHVTSYNLYR